MPISLKRLRFCEHRHAVYCIHTTYIHDRSRRCACRTHTHTQSYYIRYIYSMQNLIDSYIYIMHIYIFIYT